MGTQKCVQEGSVVPNGGSQISPKKKKKKIILICCKFLKLSERLFCPGLSQVMKSGFTILSSKQNDNRWNGVIMLSASTDNILITVFWNREGVILVDVMPRGTINKILEALPATSAP